MITGQDFYAVMTAMVPLYVTLILGYGSVRWWKIFAPEQCSVINRFVSIFAVPLLSFHFISSNNPFEMNFRFIAADTLQKLIMLVLLIIWANFSKYGSLDWMITIFSLSTLPNTLIMGIPLLTAMYGDDSGTLMVQVVVLQCILWYTLLIFLFEYRGARILITNRFPETAASIVSVKVQSDVVSLGGNDILETEAEVGEDGNLQITVSRRLTRMTTANVASRSVGVAAMTPRPSNFSGAEIYSVSSSTYQTPRGSNFSIPSGRLLNLGGTELGEPSSRRDHDDDIVVSTDQPETRGVGEADEEPLHPNEAVEVNGGKQMPPARVMSRLILVMVWRQLIRNPNTYSSLIGLIWSLISFRWHVEMPKIIAKSISILSDTGLGMAMFGLGLFMALQPRIIACENSAAVFSMAMRFLTGPMVMAIASISVGLNGTLFQVAIVQAALPQGIVPLVFANEYNVHPTVLSTAVIFGMVIAEPIIIVYYILLGL